MFIQEKEKMLTVVSHTCTTSAPFGNDKYELESVCGCITSVAVDEHYGEFNLYDADKRLIGKSVDSKISLAAKDSQTEVAKIWHRTISKSSRLYAKIQDVGNTPEYKFDPGLDEMCIGPLHIEFIDSPKEKTQFFHISVFVKVSKIWNVEECEYVK